MDHSVDRIRKVFENRTAGRLPRGEIWLGTDLFKKMNLEDNLEGHLALVRRLGQDVLCLPLSEGRSMNKTLGYRYFNLDELKKASRTNALFLAVLIDGPFQRLADRRGLMKILTEWKRGGQEAAKEYEKERIEVDLLIKRCLELSVGAIIIADDFAGERSLFLDPQDVRAHFSPFYTEAVREIHKAHSYALFHSCGKIIGLIPQLVSYEFDGLAAIQHRTNDLISLREAYGSTLTLMAGIDAEILGEPEMSLSALKEYKKIVGYFSRCGGLILCSGSGLYSGRFMERVQELYRIADSFI